jgi:hypothetical protein
MIKKLFTVTFLLFFLSFTMSGIARAQVRTPGVTEGDTFIYTTTAYWSSSDPLASIPSDVVSMNQTEYLRVGITGANGSNVATFTIWHYLNGTDSTSLGSVNIDTGVYSGGSGGFWAILAANLSVNELIHPLGQDAITVSETVIRNYAGVARETNHLIISYQNATEGATGRLDRYFDKETGILVELHDETSYTNPAATIIISWKIKDTNVWVIPEFPSVLILPLFMILTLLAVIAYRRKRTGHQVEPGSIKTHKV